MHVVYKTFLYAYIITCVCATDSGNFASWIALYAALYSLQIFFPPLLSLSSFNRFTHSAVSFLFLSAFVSFLPQVAFLLAVWFLFLSALFTIFLLSHFTHCSVVSYGFVFMFISLFFFLQLLLSLLFVMNVDLCTCNHWSATINY